MDKSKKTSSMISNGMITQLFGFYTHGNCDGKVVFLTYWYWNFIFYNCGI